MAARKQAPALAPGELAPLTGTDAALVDMVLAKPMDRVRRQCADLLEAAHALTLTNRGKKLWQLVCAARADLNSQGDDIPEERMSHATEYAIAGRIAARLSRDLPIAAMVGADAGATLEEAANLARGRTPQATAKAAE